MRIHSEHAEHPSSACYSFSPNRLHKRPTLHLSADPDGTFGASYDSQYLAALEYYAELAETHIPDATATDRGEIGGDSVA